MKKKQLGWIIILEVICSKDIFTSGLDWNSGTNISLPPSASMHAYSISQSFSCAPNSCSFWMIMRTQPREQHSWFKESCVPLTHDYSLTPMHLAKLIWSAHQYIKRLHFQLKIDGADKLIEIPWVCAHSACSVLHSGQFSKWMQAFHTLMSF